MAKYIMTIVFESNDAQQEVETRFQNAVCSFEAAQRINIAHIRKVTGNEERPNIETLQVLRPEDFSSWDRTQQCSTPVGGWPACKHVKTRTLRYSKRVHGVSGTYNVCRSCGEVVAENKKL